MMARRGGREWKGESGGRGGRAKGERGKEKRRIICLPTCRCFALLAALPYCNTAAPTCSPFTGCLAVLHPHLHYSSHAIVFASCEHECTSKRKTDASRYNKKRTGQGGMRKRRQVECRM